MDASQTKIEEFLKLVWTRGLYTNTLLSDHEGRPVTVLSHGQPHSSEGLDIVDVTVEIGGMTYTGPAAVHCNASDWHKHLHHIDPLYDNCILNITLNDDAVICRANGSIINTVVIDYPEELGERYKELTSKEGSAKCGRLLADMQPIHRCEIITRLTIERLERKYHDFLKIYQETNNNWNQVFYIMLFRSMGAGSNREAFMKLARTVHYADLCRIRESLVSVEALLLGGAGLLESPPERFPDKYTITLQQEFDHLRRRFNITPMRPKEWEISQHNPSGRLVIRIVELAALLASRDFLFSNLINCTSIEEARRILDAEASEYWTSHYQLGVEGSYNVKKIGRMMQDILCINLVVPMMFTHGQITGDENEKERALEFLEKIPGESNKFVNNWRSYGIEAESAFFSQGLLQQSKEYCIEKRCAECNIGKILLCSQ